MAAYAHEAQEAVAQIRVDGKTNEHKAALELLDMLPLEGKLVLGDLRGAAFCQRDLSQKIVKKKAMISDRSRTISRRSNRRPPGA